MVGWVAVVGASAWGEAHTQQDIDHVGGTGITSAEETYTDDPVGPPPMYAGRAGFRPPTATR